MEPHRHTSGRTDNRLIHEKSPYLLQHAGNPVEWYPWGDEAFQKAKAEAKPIFLSIGYSTCHWCHVMAHESFEDEEVARLLNEHFVSIKVDREERPDIDSIYMNVCQAITLRGGWPLSIFMTPEAKPFYAGTYFPKMGRSPRRGKATASAYWRRARRSPGGFSLGPARMEARLRTRIPCGRVTSNSVRPSITGGAGSGPRPSSPRPITIPSCFAGGDEAGIPARWTW
jgi:hypothetical protein